jgi:hypothetical protein
MGTGLDGAERNWTPEEAQAFRQRRRARNIALLAVLGGLVVLFYAMTIAKMQGGG